MSNLRKAAQQALDFLQALGRNEWGERTALIERLEAALAEPKQEPVGHADLGINNIYIFSESEPRVVPAGRTPLYTAPTPRKPLTDEEIWKCLPPDPDELAFARAIERAHGIGSDA